MSSLAAARADSFYIPKDFDPKKHVYCFISRKPFMTITDKKKKKNLKRNTEINTKTVKKQVTAVIKSDLSAPST